MAELTHDTAEDGFHEIQLSGKQLIFLFMTATVVLVVCFLCGVLVGKNVAATRGGVADSQPAPAADAPTAVAEAAPPAGEPPAPPAEDELSYHKRLQSTTPVQEPAPQAPATEAPAPPPATAPRAENIDVPTAGRSGTWFVQVQALQNRATAISMVKALAAKGYPAYLELPASGAPAIYRIRVGRYADRREAEQIARRLEKEEQFKPDVRR